MQSAANRGSTSPVGTPGHAENIDYLLSSYYGIDQDGGATKADDDKSNDDDKDVLDEKRERADTAASTGPARKSTHSGKDESRPTSPQSMRKESEKSSSENAGGGVPSPRARQRLSGKQMLPGLRLPQPSGIFDMSSQTFDAKSYVDECLKDNGVK